MFFGSFTDFLSQRTSPSPHTQCARGEFAFILALTAKTLGLINDEQYASLVLPVLLAAVAAPFGLSAAINYSNKKGLENIDEAEDATRYVSLSYHLSVVRVLRRHFLQVCFCVALHSARV